MTVLCIFTCYGIKFLFKCASMMNLSTMSLPDLRRDWLNVMAFPCYFFWWTLSLFMFVFYILSFSLIKYSSFILRTIIISKINNMALIISAMVPIPKIKKKSKKKPIFSIQAKYKILNTYKPRCKGNNKCRSCKNNIFLLYFMIIRSNADEKIEHFNK